MENPVQNIQLEELEQFEDILIAITNFEKNLDSAFEHQFFVQN
jgi:hypothetical protein